LSQSFVFLFIKQFEIIDYVEKKIQIMASFEIVIGIDKKIKIIGG